MGRPPVLKPREVVAILEKLVNSPKFVRPDRIGSIATLTGGEPQFLSIRGRTFLLYCYAGLQGKLA